MKTLTVAKIGGAIIDSPVELEYFIKLFSTIPSPKILVHGGGKSATRLAEKLNIVPEFHVGRRITNAEMLHVAAMSFIGEINTNIVAYCSKYGMKAIGISGADGNGVKSNMRDKEPIDFGYVGDIIFIDSAFFDGLLTQSMLPVLSPITHDGNGQILNTNADTVAAEIAIAMSTIYSVRLLYCFEKKGVLADASNPLSSIQYLSPEICNTMFNDGVLHSGMKPKTDNAISAKQRGVEYCWIGHYSDCNNTENIGTEIILEENV